MLVDVLVCVETLGDVCHYLRLKKGLINFLSGFIVNSTDLCISHNNYIYDIFIRSNLFYQFVIPGTTKSQTAVEELQEDALSSAESEDLTRGKSRVKKYRRSETPLSFSTSGTRTPVPSTVSGTKAQSDLDDALHQVRKVNTVFLFFCLFR